VVVVSQKGQLPGCGVAGAGMLRVRYRRIEYATTHLTNRNIKAQVKKPVGKKECFLQIRLLHLTRYRSIIKLKIR